MSCDCANAGPIRSVASVPRVEDTPRRSRVRRSMRGSPRSVVALSLRKPERKTGPGVDQAAGRVLNDLSYHMMTHSPGVSSANGSIEPKPIEPKLIDDPAASGSPVLNRRARRPAHRGYHQRQDCGWFPIADRARIDRGDGGEPNGGARGGRRTAR